MLEPISGAAVREREDLHAVNDRTIPAVFDSFDRIGERRAIEKPRAAENVGNVDFAQIRIIEAEGDAGTQNTLAPLLSHEASSVAIHTLRDRPFDAVLDKSFLRRIRLLAERARRLGLAPVQISLLNPAELAAFRQCVQRSTVMNYGLAPLLSQRRLEIRARLKNKPLRRAHHAVDDRSLE